MVVLRKSSLFIAMGKVLTCAPIPVTKICQGRLDGGVEVSVTGADPEIRKGGFNYDVIGRPVSWRRNFIFHANINFRDQFLI